MLFIALIVSLCGAAVTVYAALDLKVSGSRPELDPNVEHKVVPDLLKKTWVMYNAGYCI